MFFGYANDPRTIYVTDHLLIVIVTRANTHQFFYGAHFSQLES
jgi:hypothetical protein